MISTWFVDRIRSYLVGTQMKGAKPPTIPHPLHLDRHWQIWSELVFISICHQANWDRLHQRVMDIATNDFCALLPENLLNLQPKRFDELFGSALDSARIRRAERITLLHRLAQQSQNWSTINGPSWVNGQRVRLSGPDGLYSWLNQMQVFSADPVQKKARVFVHQLLRYGLIDVFDSEHIAPAVDYHLMRLYVRTGRIRPLEEWEERLKEEGGTVRVEPITALRRAVEESMYYTATGAGLRVDEVNHLEWQIARSFCLRQSPHCSSGPLLEKPVDAAVANLSCQLGCRCPLSRECLAATDSSLREIVDPQSAKSAKSYY